MIDDITAPIAESESDSISDNEKATNVDFIEQAPVVGLRRSKSDPLDITLESTLSESLEDLVSTFDEKIYKCFLDLDKDTTIIAPINNEPGITGVKEFSTEYECIESVPLDWNHLTDISEKPAHNHPPAAAAAVAEKPGNVKLVTNENASLKSAEGLLIEIQEMMDYSDNNTDFEGIEESFYDSDLSESVKDVIVNFQSEWSGKEGSTEWQKALNTMGSEPLLLLVSDLRSRIRTLSDCLLIHLATRDDLEYEREVRDRFMLLLQGVQRRKREIVSQIYKKQTSSNSHKSGVSLRSNNSNSRARTRNNRWSWNGNWGQLFRNKHSSTSQINASATMATKPPFNNRNRHNSQSNGYTNQHQTRQWQLATLNPASLLASQTGYVTANGNCNNNHKNNNNNNLNQKNSKDLKSNPVIDRDQNNNDNSTTEVNVTNKNTTIPSTNQNATQPVSANQNDSSMSWLLRSRRMMMEAEESDISSIVDRNSSVNPNQKRQNMKSIEKTIKFLSTTIPFHSGISSVSLDHLQTFNKILLAVLQENTKLDDILADYIVNMYTACVGVETSVRIGSNGFSNEIKSSNSSANNQKAAYLIST